VYFRDMLVGLICFGNEIDKSLSTFGASALKQLLPVLLVYSVSQKNHPAVF